MAKSKDWAAGDGETKGNTAGLPAVGPLKILGSKQEVADELKMSMYQFDQLLQRYPFEDSGVPGKIMGKWRVCRDDVHRWFRFVQQQELRHPEARRLRPEEPPEISLFFTAAERKKVKKNVHD